MISHKYKCIFIAIPKTASSSICNALIDKENNPGCQPDLIDTEEFSWGSHRHHTLEDVYDPKLISATYFKFAFVRNPWDRVLSAYMRNHGRVQTLHKNFSTYILNGMTQYGNDKEDQPHGNQIIDSFYGDQLSRIQINGKVGLDFVGRYENLEEDFLHIAELLQLDDKKLPHLKKTAHEHYPQYYTSETQEIIGKKFKKEIEYFGYKFGE